VPNGKGLTSNRCLTEQLVVRLAIDNEMDASAMAAFDAKSDDTDIETMTPEKPKLRES
jgi:hypothetical protein